MTKVIIIDKVGNQKESNIKNFKSENVFKKCGLRQNKDFSLRHTWKFESKFISLYAKDSGRANNENKYDLPPPLDSKLYFGKMILVCHYDKDIIDDTTYDLCLDDWKRCYDKLFGGFEDLGDDDSYSEEEEIPESMKTKEGYSKEDGFIVDDDEDEDDNYIPDEDEEDEAKSTTEDEDDEELMGVESDLDIEDDEDDEDDEDEDEDDDDEDSDDLGSELSEESYIESDEE